MLEASKVLIGNYLLQPDDVPPKKLTLEEFLPVFDRYKDMASPNIRNKVMTFRFLRRYGIIYSITKLCGIILWAFVQENKFTGQEVGLEKVFVFKMSKVGPGMNPKWGLIFKVKPIRHFKGDILFFLFKKNFKKML